MSFKQFDHISPEDRVYEARMRKVGAAIAAGLPGKRVYGEAGIRHLLESEVQNDRNETLLMLEKYGVVTRKEHYGCELCDPGSDQPCLHACDPIPIDIRFEISGTLDNMIQQLKGKKYFISFASADGRTQATLLHGTLQAVGLNGFFSDESIQNGNSWKDEIIANLKASSLVFLVESPLYHTRPRCQVERDYALSLGKPVLRIGVCDRSLLTNCPIYLDDYINHSNFENTSGFDLNSVLGLNIPANPVMAARKEASMNLTASIPPTMVDKVASTMNLSQAISKGVSSDQRLIELLDIVFASSNLADGFTARLDVTTIF